MASELSPYLVLITFNGSPSPGLHNAISQLSPEPIKPIMISGGFVVLGVMWDRTAHDLWSAIAKTNQLTNLKEMFIVQSGEDWCTAPDKSCAGWLIRHVGDPNKWKKNP